MAELPMDPTLLVAVRAKLYAEVADFLYPKRKPVDVGVSEEGGVVIQLEMCGSFVT
jgi:hypothetical protein